MCSVLMLNIKNKQGVRYVFVDEGTIVQTSTIKKSGLHIITFVLNRCFLHRIKYFGVTFSTLGQLFCFNIITIQQRLKLYRVLWLGTISCKVVL